MVVTSGLEEPPQLEQWVGQLTSTHHCCQLRTKLVLVENVRHAKYRHNMMGKHHRSLCLHVHAPHEVKQEVAKAEHHYSIVKFCVGFPKVGEWPRTCDTC